MTDQRSKTAKKSTETPSSFFKVMKTFFWRPPFKKIIWMLLALLGIESFLLLTFQDGLIYAKGEEISFTALLELIFILFTIFLIDNVLEDQAKKREDRDRQSVHKAAVDDARFIFDQIYSLGYEVLGASIAKGNNKSMVKQSADKPSSILKFILDMAAEREMDIEIADELHKSRKVGWRKYLTESIDDLHMEVENYQQRYGAFLAAKVTESEGSELMHNLSSIRRSLREISRTLQHGDGDVHLQLSRRDPDGHYSLKIDGGGEQIAILTIHDKVYGNPVRSFRKFCRSHEALLRNVKDGDAGPTTEDGDANGLRDEILPEERRGGFMSGIEKGWPVRRFGDEEQGRASHHAQDYLDKLLRFPPPWTKEEAWFNVVYMGENFYQHSHAYQTERCELLRYAGGGGTRRRTQYTRCDSSR